MESPIPASKQLDAQLDDDMRQRMRWYNDDVPPAAMKWLQKELDSERNRQEARIQSERDRFEDRLQQALDRTDMGKVQRKLEQMSRRQEESLEQIEGSVRTFTERLFELEKTVKKNEQKSEDAIEKAGLAFKKHADATEQDRQKFATSITQVNANFQRVSSDMAAHMNEKTAMGQKLVALEAVTQQIQREFAGFASRFEQQVIQSQAQHASVLQLVETQKQHVNSLEVRIQQLHTTNASMVNATPQSPIPDASLQAKEHAQAFRTAQVSTPVPAPAGPAGALNATVPNVPSAPPAVSGNGKGPSTHMTHTGMPKQQPHGSMPHSSVPQPTNQPRHNSQQHSYHPQPQTPCKEPNLRKDEFQQRLHSQPGGGQQQQKQMPVGTVPAGPGGYPAKTPGPPQNKSPCKSARGQAPATGMPGHMPVYSMPNVPRGQSFS